MMEWLEITLYQMNTALGLVLTAALFALLVLMIVIWPRTPLNRAALWFMFTIWAVMLRWCLATLWPDLFGIKASAIASLFFLAAVVMTVWFAIIAWYSYLTGGSDAPPWRQLLRRRRP